MGVGGWLVGADSNVLDVGVERRFFFEAEYGIRDADVTGVQTCALPIYQNFTWLFGASPAGEAPKSQVKFWFSAPGELAKLRGELENAVLEIDEKNRQGPTTRGEQVLDRKSGV